MGARGKDFKDTIGGRLGKFRYQAGMTQEEFSQELDINVKSLQDYENDRSPIPDSIKKNIYRQHDDFDVHKLVTGESFGNSIKAALSLIKDNISTFSDEEFVEIRRMVDEETYNRLHR